MITISIVSHGHGAMVERLISQAVLLQEVDRVVLTLNIPETLALPASEKIVIVNNAVSQGFGANHNAAFQHCETAFFCVLNPDVLFLDDPFPSLMKAIETPNVALVAPMVCTSAGEMEDSVRHFPTIATLLAKRLGFSDGRYAVKSDDACFEPDWVAGMFMLFRAMNFRALGGFDEAFFLYYEDVDICARIWKSGAKIVFCPSARIVHDAQRASHKNWRFRRWHLQSLVRYLGRYSLHPPGQRQKKP